MRLDLETSNLTMQNDLPVMPKEEPSQWDSFVQFLKDQPVLTIGIAAGLAYIFLPKPRAATFTGRNPRRPRRKR